MRCTLDPRGLRACDVGVRGEDESGARRTRKGRRGNRRPNSNSAEPTRNDVETLAPAELGARAEVPIRRQTQRRGKRREDRNQSTERRGQCEARESECARG
ncbi:hypothetical protein TRVL_07580 [Trypanosoma vivax]|nr:hypothetical protein TRVL_07580 [Trypanosoma vivax]